MIAPIICTTDEVALRHRAVPAPTSGDHDFLGIDGWRGSTVCGEPAMDQAELTLWYAEWGVPTERRRRIGDLPDCPACLPAEEKP